MFNMDKYKELTELNKIKTSLLMGLITYDMAKEMAAPYLKIMNDISKQIAKKYGVRPKLISFAGFMR